MSYETLSDSEIDAGSPITETLMDKYRDRDDYVREAAETFYWLSDTAGGY